MMKTAMLTRRQIAKTAPPPRSSVLELARSDSASRQKARAPAAAVDGFPVTRRGGASLQIARIRHLQRTYGNRAVQRQVQRAATGALTVQRLPSISDVIPDFILNPIKSLVGEVGDFASGVTTKSDKAASGARTDADAAATEVDEDTNAKVSDSKTQGEAAASKADAQATTAGAAGNAAKTAGEAQATQLNNALPGRWSGRKRP